jgi:hypothetical protein
VSSAEHGRTGESRFEVTQAELMRLGSTTVTEVSLNLLHQFHAGEKGGGGHNRRERVFGRNEAITNPFFDHVRSWSSGSRALLKGLDAGVQNRARVHQQEK